MYTEFSFLGFANKFSTEEKCHQYLLKCRWPGGFECPDCQHRDASWIATRRLFQCSNCRRQVSVTAGTMFHKTRTPLVKWFWMIYFLSKTKTGVSISHLQRELDVLPKTAWSMAHKIRKAMADRNLLYVLTGRTETDDSVFGAKNVKGKRGRGAAKKTNVIVSVQVTPENRPIFACMDVVERLDSEHVKKTIEKQIQQGTEVKTDGLNVYRVLGESGYEHRVEIVGEPEQASVKFPWVHILIANIKGIIRGVHHGVSDKHLHAYLSEFCYRFNRRFQPKESFDRLVTACLNSTGITLAELMT